MTRLLFWILIALCALVAVRLAVRHKSGPSHRPVTARPAQKSAEAMVACAHCGVYLPRSDALVLHGQTWCCREHADQHSKS